MIIFINGTINSGKTTVSKLLAEKILKSAVIEVDLLRSFIDWMPIEQTVPINLENTVNIIKTFVSRDITPIVPYPLSQSNFIFFAKVLSEYEDQLHFFTLSPEKSVVTKNRGSRELTAEERKRIEHHFKIGLTHPDFGTVIDNTHQTPSETVEEIHTLLIKNS